MTAVRPWGVCKGQGELGDREPRGGRSPGPDTRAGRKPGPAWARGGARRGGREEGESPLTKQRPGHSHHLFNCPSDGGPRGSTPRAGSTWKPPSTAPCRSLLEESIWPNRHCYSHLHPSCSLTWPCGEWSAQHLAPNLSPSPPSLLLLTREVPTGPLLPRRHPSSDTQILLWVHPQN